MYTRGAPLWAKGKLLNAWTLLETCMQTGTSLGMRAKYLCCQMEICSFRSQVPSLWCSTYPKLRNFLRNNAVQLVTIWCSLKVTLAHRHKSWSEQVYVSTGSCHLICVSIWFSYRVGTIHDLCLCSSIDFEKIQIQVISGVVFQRVWIGFYLLCWRF